MLCSLTFLWHILTDVDHSFLNAQTLDLDAQLYEWIADFCKFYLMIEVGFFY